MNRQERVAWLAGQGQRTAEIAQLLNKSPMTVKKQLQSVYEKLDVRGRGRLIALLRSADHPYTETEQSGGINLTENERNHHKYEQNHNLFPSLSSKLPTRWTSSQTTTGSDTVTPRERR